MVIHETRLNAKGRFVAIIYLCTLSGQMVSKDSTAKDDVTNLEK